MDKKTLILGSLAVLGCLSAIGNAMRYMDVVENNRKLEKRAANYHLSLVTLASNSTQEALDKTSTDLEFLAIMHNQ